MKILRLLFGLDQPIDRKTYLTAGFSLAALKYGIDFLVVYLSTGKIWTLLAYLSPALFFRQEAVGPTPEFVLGVMEIYTLPFGAFHWPDQILQQLLCAKLSERL
ncbi:MAG: hypothetical protein AAGH89_10055, partial [Verrucomicrobiota bacterium]